MKKTTDKTQMRKDHDEFLAGMSPEERVMHVAAGAMALYSQMDSISDDIAEALAGGAEISRGAMIGIPVMMAVGIGEVMGEMIKMLEEHKIIDRAKVDEFIVKKRAEIKAQAKEEDKPEGWCPNCETVHGDHEDQDPESGLRNVAKALVSMMRAHQAAAKAKSETEAEAPPPGTPIH